MMAQVRKRSRWWLSPGRRSATGTVGCRCGSGAAAGWQQRSCLAVGAAVLLAVALTSWGLVSAVATLIAGALVIGAVFLARQAALWTSTRLSVLPDASPPSDQLDSSARLDATARTAAAESLVTTARRMRSDRRNRSRGWRSSVRRDHSHPRARSTDQAATGCGGGPGAPRHQRPVTDQTSAPGGGDSSVADNSAPAVER